MEDGRSARDRGISRLRVEQRGLELARPGALCRPRAVQGERLPLCSTRRIRAISRCRVANHRARQFPTGATGAAKRTNSESRCRLVDVRCLLQWRGNEAPLVLDSDELVGVS